MSKPAISPSAAHFESIARSRPADHHSDLFSNLPQSAARLLDAGCASGRLTLRLTERAAFAVGIDLSCDLIDLAHRFERERETKNVAWVVGDMEHMPFESGSFDVVASTNAVRLTSVPIALNELARLVKSGRLMAVQDIIAEPHPLRPILLPYVIRTLKSIPRYLRLYGPFMLLRILAYRFSSVELRRATRVDRLSLNTLEGMYDRAAPGSKVHTNRWGYLALWQNPHASVTQ